MENTGTEHEDHMELVDDSSDDDEATHSGEEEHHIRESLGSYKGVSWLFNWPPRRKSWVWWFFKQVEKNTKGKIVTYGECGCCGKLIKAEWSKTGTSSLKNHLEKHCKKSPLLLKLKKQKNQPSVAQTITGSVATNKFCQAKCDQNVVVWIIDAEMPFNCVERGSWKTMINGFCHQYKPPGRKKIALLVFKVFDTEKAKIKSVMANRRVSITTDTWTSIQNVNYMVITAHFMDLHWKLHKRIINFTKIDSHKGTDIGRLLMDCFDQWGIKNVLIVTVDNASSNDTTLTYLLGRLKDMGNLLFDGIYMHMRCACHILNLIVKDGLQEMNKSVEAIRNAAKFVHSSPARLTLFRKYAQLEVNDEKANVPTDVCTRWNSTYKMLSIASKYKAVFSRLMADDRGYGEYFTEKSGPPIQDDWDKAVAFIFFLKRFYEATLKLSASKSETSNLIYFETMKIIRELEERILI